MKTEKAVKLQSKLGSRFSPEVLRCFMEEASRLIEVVCVATARLAIHSRLIYLNKSTFQRRVNDCVPDVLLMDFSWLSMFLSSKKSALNVI